MVRDKREQGGENVDLGEQKLQLVFTPPIFGHFIERLNRFVAVVEHEGLQSRAHIATSGRLRELLLPAAPVLLEKSNDPARRTAFSLRAVEHNGVWVSVDAQIPNKLMGKALRQKALPPFAAAFFLRSEPSYGGGCFDFLLTAEGQLIYICAAPASSGVDLRQIRATDC